MFRLIRLQKHWNQWKNESTHENNEFARMSQARVYVQQIILTREALQHNLLRKITCKMFQHRRLRPDNMNLLIYWRRQCRHCFQIVHEVPFFIRFITSNCSLIFLFDLIRYERLSIKCLTMFRQHAFVTFIFTDIGMKLALRYRACLNFIILCAFEFKLLAVFCMLLIWWNFLNFENQN